MTLPGWSQIRSIFYFFIFFVFRGRHDKIAMKGYTFFCVFYGSVTSQALRGQRRLRAHNYSCYSKYVEQAFRSEIAVIQPELRAHLRRMISAIIPILCIIAVSTNAFPLLRRGELSVNSSLPLSPKVPPADGSIIPPPSAPQVNGTAPPPPPKHLPPPPPLVTISPISLNVTSDNSTIVEIVESESSGEQKTHQVGTSAFLLATIPMLALVGAFFAQCKRGRSPNRQSSHSKLSTAGQDEEERICQAEDKEESNPENPLFEQRMFQPQDNRIGEPSEEDMEDSAELTAPYTPSMRV